MTPQDLINDLRSRINPAYAAQLGTESYERRLCVEAMESQEETIDTLKAAIIGLLKYHQEGDDGAELPREYWSPGYRAAVEQAEAALLPNAKVSG